jgi:hypothetical protein
MIKEGDTLIFKSNSAALYDSEYRQYEGDICICKIVIHDKIDSSIEFKIKNTRNNREYFYHNDSKGVFYIYNYYYTLAEWRNQQIDKILEDGAED